jgi:hypothetical protein
MERFLPSLTRERELSVAAATATVALCVFAVRWSVRTSLGRETDQRRATQTHSMPTPSDCFRAVRMCDQVLASLQAYPCRDEVIERLELAIMDERLEAMLGARELATIAP